MKKKSIAARNVHSARSRTAQIQKDRTILRHLGIITLILTVLFVIATILCTVLHAGRLELYLPEGNSAANFYPEEEGIVDLVFDSSDPSHMTVLAKGRGSVFLINRDPESRIALQYVSVSAGNIIFNKLNGNYSGCEWTVLFVQIYIISIAILLITSFIVRCRSELYSYTTLYFGGIALFMLTGAMEMLYQRIILSRFRLSVNMSDIYYIIRNAGFGFMIWTMIPMLLFAIALVISNIALIRREGRKPANLLGIAMSLAIVGGYIMYFIINRLFSSGSEWDRRLNGALTGAYTTVCVYMQAMLLSAAICGLTAAKKRPFLDKTHVMILGCAVAKDGTPYPLLRGRIDRAIAFAEKQKAETGQDVIFVPSGGQGADEVISEAACMQNYLCKQGISAERILPESASANTKENMRFSLKKITETCSSPQILFSTSDYHVLRSGIISQDEGLNAEGIGCRTKWYFWPNAFIREFIGLLWRKRRQHILSIILLTVLFVALNLLCPM